MDNALVVKQLSKVYSNFELKNISFEIPKGKIMGLVGENGAGKSTTINGILDLIKPDYGEVRFWGQQLTNNHKLKEDIGVVFDEVNFYETLTPKKVGNIAKNAYTKWDMELYRKYIKRFDIPEDKEIKTLSKGTKMKLCIAVAMSHNPKLLILDESTSGLDPIVRNDVLEVFLEFVRDTENSILISSHITTDLEKVADYITFIHNGKLLFCNSKSELLNKYGIIQCRQNEFDLIDKNDILACRKENSQWQILVANKKIAENKYNLNIENTTLEDILLLFVKGERG